MTGIRKLLLTIFIRPAVLAVEIGLASFPANINSARICSMRWNLQLFSCETKVHSLDPCLILVYLVQFLVPTLLRSWGNLVYLTVAKYMLSFCLEYILRLHLQGKNLSFVSQSFPCRMRTLPDLQLWVQVSHYQETIQSTRHCQLVSFENYFWRSIDQYHNFLLPLDILFSLFST